MSNLEDSVAGGADAGDEAGGGKKKSKKKLIIVGALALLLLGGGGAAFALGLFGGEQPPAAAEGAHGGTEPAAAEGEQGGGDHGAPEDGHGGTGDGEAKDGEDAGACGAAFVEVPDILVNLNTDTRVSRYLKLSLSLDVKSEADKATLEKIAPKIFDQLQTFLRELRVDDLRGSRATARLREELTWRINLAAQPVQVCDVLFRSMLIQ